MRKGTVCTRDTGAGSPGGWGMERRGEERGPGPRQLFPPALGTKGASAVRTPRSVLRSRPTFWPKQPPSRLGGTRQSSGPRRNGLQAGTKPGDPESGTTLPPRTPPKAGEFIPRAHLGQHCAHPEKGLVTREGLGSGPCHPGLFSGQELGIKIDNGGRS